MFLIKRKHNGQPALVKVEVDQPVRGRRDYSAVSDRCHANSVRYTTDKAGNKVKLHKGRFVPCDRHLQAKYACRRPDGKFAAEADCVAGKYKKRAVEASDKGIMKKVQKQREQRRLARAQKKSTRQPRPAAQQVTQGPPASTAVPLLPQHASTGLLPAQGASVPLSAEDIQQALETIERATAPARRQRRRTRE